MGIDLTGYRKLYAAKKAIRIVYKIVADQLCVDIIAMVHERDLPSTRLRLRARTSGARPLSTHPAVGSRLATRVFSTGRLARQAILTAFGDVHVRERFLLERGNGEPLLGSLP